MFHVEHFVKIKQCTRTCLRSISHIINVPRGTFMILFIISIQGLSLLLTFSKSAIIGLFIGFLYLYIKKCSIPVQMFHVEHSTGQAWNNSNILKTSHIYKKLLLIVAIMAMLFVILKPDTYSLIFKSLQERTFYLNVSRGTFLLHPLIGIGAGQFIINMRDIIDIQSWQYQPVHNVFLLILNEFGIVVLFMFLYFIYKMFNSNTNVPPQYKCSTWNILRGTRGTLHAASAKHYAKQSASIYFKAILVSFIFIMLFDHYFWDIQQGQILLWLLFGIIVGNNRK